MNLALVGKRIQEFRTGKHMSQADLAELTDLSTYHVGSIETGKRGLSIEALVKIADALEVTTDSILLGFSRSNPSPYIESITALLSESSPFERNVMLKLLYSTKVALQDSMVYLNKRQGE